MSGAPDRTQLEPGYRLDRYELLCPIAHGGMASVWLARLHGKHGFEKLVAIKTILPQYAQDPRFQRMFLEEARIAAGIEHTNVAQILDLGEQHEVLYLVMEWVDGDSLSKLNRAVERRKQTIALGVTLRIIADTCAGLHAAHEMRDKHGKALGVVHRDVSPQNILVSVKGVAKLIDFGIAKARDRATGETNTGLLKGKIQYMAPEQAMGKGIDHRSDIWALGAVLYYLLTGTPPFDGPNQLATLHMLTAGDPPPPIPAVYPPQVIALCMQALSHDPDARPRTAAELQRAIERVMVETGAHATASNVADFVAEHLAERAETRKKAVQLALSASAERRRLSVLLVPPADSGVTDSELEIPRAGAPSMSDGEAIPPLPIGDPMGEDAFRVRPLSEPEAPSSATLGEAAFVFHYGGKAYHSRTLWAVAIGIFGAACIVALFALVSVFMRKHRAESVAASPGMQEAPRPAERAPPVPPVVASAAATGPVQVIQPTGAVSVAARSVTPPPTPAPPPSTRPAPVSAPKPTTPPPTRTSVATKPARADKSDEKTSQFGF